MFWQTSLNPRLNVSVHNFREILSKLSKNYLNIITLSLEMTIVQSLRICALHSFYLFLTELRFFSPQSGLPGPKKLKRPNLAMSSFKKGQILKNKKWPNKGQISLKKFVKITKKIEFHKIHKICSDLFKTCLKI